MSGGHTPGPWIAEHYTPDVVTPQGEVIAKCGDSVMLTMEERKANARLIAAAPETAAERHRLKEQRDDLLEVLEILVCQATDACGAVAEFNNMPCNSLREKLPTTVIRLEKKIELARSAIAKTKADGETV